MGWRGWLLLIALLWIHSFTAGEDLRDAEIAEASRDAAYVTGW